MTHRELVARAARWLAGSRRMMVVLAEPRSAFGEQPDAIGWRCGKWSVVVECKATRADFLADADKLWRRPDGCGVGCERWYLTPPGLVRPDEVGDWGLLYAKPATTQTVKPCASFDGRAAGLRTDAGAKAEITLLVSALWKMEHAGENGVRPPRLTIAPEWAAEEEREALLA